MLSSGISECVRMTCDSLLTTSLLQVVNTESCCKLIFVLLACLHVVPAILVINIRAWIYREGFLESLFHEILSSCSDTFELMIHESLLISKLKHSLNVQGSSITLNLLYNSVFVSVLSPFLYRPVEVTRRE